MSSLAKVLQNGPIFIVISGAPGSGKTTLARILSEKLNLLHIERDILLEQVYQLHKNDTNYDRARVGIPKVYEIVASLLTQQISIVMDATLYKNKSEQDIKLLGDNAKLLNIHCTAGDSSYVKERFRKREIVLNNGDKPDWLDGHMDMLDDIYEDVKDPLQLDCSRLVVETYEGYNPTINEVVEWVENQLS